MFDQPWAIGFLLGIGILYALLLATFVRSELGDTEHPEPHSPETVDGSKIVCPEYGAANERGYRYCRSCVAELPGAMGVEHTDTNPVSGFTR